MNDPIEQAVILIMSFEGFRDLAYQDVGGVWTVGYGQTGKGVGPGTRVTQEQAEARLRERVASLWTTINHSAYRDLNANQATALISLAYNIGLGALERSTLFGLVQDGQMLPAAEEFMRWDKARQPGGSLTVVPGLRARRAAEKMLFMRD